MTRLFFALLAGLLGLALSLPTTASAQDGYRLRPGDVLRIEVLEDPSLSRSVLVAPDGRVSVPLAGGIRASGRTVEAVQTDLASRLGPNFATAPTVFVALERLADRIPSSGGGVKAEAPTIIIYIMGEAAKPGKIAVAPGTTVLQLFAEMGGFSKFAATKRIQLRRTDPKSKVETVYKLNYNAIEAGSSKSGNTTLADGDVIVVPQRKLFE